MFSRVLLSVVMFASLTLAACGGGGSSEETGGTAGDTTASDVSPESTYRSDHDPNTFYTLDDIDMVGSYLKLDFAGLTDDQFNRVIHRLRTELSTCGSGNTIDECLVTRPLCRTAVVLAEMVIREEKLTS